MSSKIRRLERRKVEREKQQAMANRFKIFTKNYREGVLDRAKFVEYAPTKRVIKFLDDYRKIEPFSIELSFPYVQFWLQGGYDLRSQIKYVTCSLNSLESVFDTQLFDLPLPHVSKGEICGAGTIHQFWNGWFKLNYNLGTYSYRQIQDWAKKGSWPHLYKVDVLNIVYRTLMYQSM